MRTNIVINEKLMSRVLRDAESKTKREAVEAGLQLLAKVAKQRRVRAARGKLAWSGNLGAMRRDA